MRIETLQEQHKRGGSDVSVPSSAQRAVCELKRGDFAKHAVEGPFIRSESGMRIETPNTLSLAAAAAPSSAQRAVCELKLDRHSRRRGEPTLHPLRERYAN